MIDLTAEVVCADCGAPETERCRPGCGERVHFESAAMVELGAAEFNAAPTAPGASVSDGPIAIDQRLVEAFGSDVPTLKVHYGCLRPVDRCVCRPEAPALDHRLWIGAPR